MIGGDDMIQDITNFIFVEHELEKVDIIFIPGSTWPETCEKAAQLYLEGIAPYILPSGKYGVKKDYFSVPESLQAKYQKPYDSEWEFMTDILIQCSVRKEAILKEDNSMYPHQNAFNSRRVTDARGLQIKRAIICCQAFHARRSLMYYQWAYPDVRFVVCPVETQGINRENWYKHKYGIKCVMRELMRCGSQFVEAIPDYYHESLNRLI